MAKNEPNGPEDVKAGPVNETPTEEKAVPTDKPLEAGGKAPGDVVVSFDKINESAKEHKAGGLEAAQKAKAQKAPAQKEAPAPDKAPGKKTTRKGQPPKASELAGYTNMPCVVRNLTDDEAITQMAEGTTNQREKILPSERAKALKMQLEAIKRQGARGDLDNFGPLGPKLATGQRSNQIVAERNKMTVKTVQRYFFKSGQHMLLLFVLCLFRYG